MRIEICTKMGHDQILYFPKAGFGIKLIDMPIFYMYSFLIKIRTCNLRTYM